MRAARCVVAIAMLGVLSGCWTVPGAGPQRSGHNQFESTITTVNVASLAKEWTWQADWTTAREVSDPIVSVSGVHVSVGHELVTIRPTDGMERWRTPIFAADNPVLVARNPAAANGRVYVSVQSASPIVASGTRAFDANTGQDLGVAAAAANDVTVPRDSKLLGEYTLSGGSSNLVLTGYFVKDLVDATKSWTANLNLFSGGGVISPSSPAVGADKFFFANGQTLLAYPIAEPAGCVVVSGNFRTCPPTWSLAFGPGLTRPTLSTDEKFIAVGDAGHVMMFTVDGASMWTAGLPTTAPPSAPLSIDASTVFAVSAGKLHAYGRGGCGLTSCSPLWSGDTAGVVTLQPAIAGGIVYTATSAGVIRAFAAAGCGTATCEPVWKYDVGVPITGGPSISGGHVLVGTQDGRVISFRAGATG